MNTMIILTIATIFVTKTFGCELTLGQDSALCQAIEADVTKVFAQGATAVSGVCSCDAGKAKDACDELQTQKSSGEYKFAPVCEKIKLVLPDLIKAALNCNDQDALKNSYAKVAQCNAENAASSSSNTMMVMEASTTQMLDASSMMIKASSSANEMPAMSTSMDNAMMSSAMVENMNSTMTDMMASTSKMEISASSSMAMNGTSSSVVPGAANSITFTHSVLVITALVAMLASLM